MLFKSVAWVLVLLKEQFVCAVITKSVLSGRLENGLICILFTKSWRLQAGRGGKQFLLSGVCPFS